MVDLSFAGAINTAALISGDHRSMKPVFFVKRGDRLIARLKHMFYAWRFVDQIGGKLIMVWPDLPVFWHQFDGQEYNPWRLFNLLEFYANGGSDRLVFLEAEIGYPPVRRSLYGPEFAAMRPNGFKRSFFEQDGLVFHEQNALTFQFEDEPRTAAHTQTTLRKLYDSLPLEPVMARSLAGAKDRIQSDDYVGLHVRRGDVDEMLKTDLPKLANGGLPPDRLALLMGHYVARTARDVDYHSRIEAAIKDGRKILYFSDSPETIASFAGKFGRKHFVDAGIFRGRFPIQKAFLDFNLLIGASTIISTGSNYASFAATLGGGELINVAGSGGIDELEQHLHDTYLSGLSLPSAERGELQRELARQYDRRKKMRPLEAAENLPPGM